MGWFAATPTFAPLKLPVKTMRIKNTTASEKKTSGNLPPSFEELLFLSIDSDLTSLLDIIEFKSNNTGYCFGSDKELAKLLKQSISSIKKKLKRLSDLGAIFRIRISRNKKGGSRRIIFTNKNYQNRDQILAAFPPNKIIGVRNSLNYIHPDAQKILSSVSMISTPIYYGNNASISTIKTPSNSTSLSTSLPSAINRANHLYDKKVVNKAIPQKAKPLPPFQTKNTQIKDYIKMSDDEKLANAENYFSVGHQDEDESDRNWCWIWDGNKVITIKGGTHGINFTHEVADKNFKGWYDAAKNIISVVFPEHELRKLGDRRPTKDDIPQYLYQKLISKFGKRKPRIVVFESKRADMSKKDLKLLLKEIVQQVLEPEDSLEEIPYDKPYGGWLDPDLNFHEVDIEGHRSWALTYLKAHTPKKQFSVEETTYDKMYKLGFIRVIISGDTLYYEYEEGHLPAPRKIKALKDFAVEYRCTFIKDDRTKKTEDLLQEIKSNPPVTIIVNETMTYKELLSLTTDDRKERAANVNVRSIPVSVEEGQEQWNFRYKSSPQTTVTDEPFEGHILFLKGEVEKGDNAMDLECKVDCGCPDFMYRFAYNDTQKGASDVGPDSLSGCANRRPKPAYDYGEGLCKHLTALGRYLRTKIAATKKSNLFEAINDVAGQGPFNITYYD